MDNYNSMAEQRQETNRVNRASSMRDYACLGECRTQSPYKMRDKQGFPPLKTVVFAGCLLLLLGGIFFVAKNIWPAKKAASAKSVVAISTGNPAPHLKNTQISEKNIEIAILQEETAMADTIKKTLATKQSSKFPKNPVAKNNPPAQTFDFYSMLANPSQPENKDKKIDAPHH